MPMTKSAPVLSLMPVVGYLLRLFWRDARLTLLTVIAASLIGACAAILAPILFARSIDVLALRGQSSLALQLIFLYAVLYGASVALGQAGQFMIFMCAERLRYIADCAFFERLMAKSADFFLNHNQSEIGNARREGGSALNLVIQYGFGGVLPGIVQICLSLTLLGGVLSWEIALIVFIYGMVIITLDYFRAKCVNPYLDTAVAKAQSGSSLVGNAIAMIESLCHTRSEPWIIRRFQDTAADTYANWRRYAVVSSVFSATGGIAVAVQLIVTFYILVPRYQLGRISLGDLVLFNTLLLQLNQPFHLLGQAIKIGADVLGRLKPFVSVWNAPENSDAQAAISFRPSRGTIVFDKVSFSYTNGRGIDDLSFTLRRGTPAFLTGETGSGKSTVLRLLLKDFCHAQGHILIDGTDLSDITRDDWYSHIGIVPQDITLLNDTLGVNIVLGREFDAQRLRRAAQRAAILERIEAMPDSFETIVGERGMKLSGGERQRIAIARALYTDPEFLILDEASSALDAKTEAEIMSGLRKQAKTLTILAVTHRHSVIKDGDQVIHIPVK